MNDTTKTFHRWTKEEDKKLLDAIAKEKTAYDSIGQPGGIARDVFWGQIPGRIGVLATPLACQMRYRTLTSPTKWAEKRRKGAPSKARDPMQEISAALADMQKQIDRLLRMWEPEKKSA